MMPKSISEWLAAACAVLSAVWLYTGINLEPTIALVTSLLAFIGLRKSHSRLAAHKQENKKGNGAHFEALSLIKSAALYERIKILRKSHMHLSKITPFNIPSVLDLIPLYERTEALKLLAPSLAYHPSPSETEKILEMLPLFERTEASTSLTTIVASNRLEPTSGSLSRPSSAQP